MNTQPDDNIESKYPLTPASTANTSPEDNNLVVTRQDIVKRQLCTMHCSVQHDIECIWHLITKTLTQRGEEKNLGGLKGQLIPKGYFVVFKSARKPT